MPWAEAHGTGAGKAFGLQYSGGMSVTRIVVHIVWATHRRLPVIPEYMDSWLHALLQRKAEDLGCELLAAGNAADHVHVVATLAAKVPLSELCKRLKGASSHLSKLEFADSPVSWQDGYWADSWHPDHTEPLVRYVRAQRDHHHCQHLQLEWEPPSDPAPPSGRRPFPQRCRGLQPMAPRTVANPSSTRLSHHFLRSYGYFLIVLEIVDVSRTSAL